MAGMARLHARPAAAMLVHQAARVADVPVLVHVVGAALAEAAHDLRRFQGIKRALDARLMLMRTEWWQLQAITLQGLLMRQHSRSIRRCHAIAAMKQSV